ncbi:SDR family NAD(P)-dependent oxidoreductase [Nocardioides convexus]|uniref:SDR family NAD(P)-dependent oxidoreductase n=1 Tax=Nocardioides convexus TaxID=2712224 RepID=UPI002418865C|nr:SDR family NAD(P)-dependent oxidoreductase [Nocardioides convexus]
MTSTARPARFTDRRIVVTGAAGGLGQVVAGLFREEGARVVATDVVAAEGVVPCDLADDVAREEFVEATLAELGGLDVLCNVAGVQQFAETRHDHRRQPAQAPRRQRGGAPAPHPVVRRGAGRQHGQRGLGGVDLRGDGAALQRAVLRLQGRAPARHALPRRRDSAPAGCASTASPRVASPPR